MDNLYTMCLQFRKDVEEFLSANQQLGVTIPVTQEELYVNNKGHGIPFSHIDMPEGQSIILYAEDYLPMLQRGYTLRMVMTVIKKRLESVMGGMSQISNQSINDVTEETIITARKITPDGERAAEITVSKKIDEFGIVAFLKNPCGRAITYHGNDTHYAGIMKKEFGREATDEEWHKAYVYTLKCIGGLSERYMDGSLAVIDPKKWADYFYAVDSTFIREKVKYFFPMRYRYFCIRELGPYGVDILPLPDNNDLREIIYNGFKGSGLDTVHCYDSLKDEYVSDYGSSYEEWDSYGTTLDERCSIVIRPMDFAHINNHDTNVVLKKLDEYGLIAYLKTYVPVPDGDDRCCEVYMDADALGDSITDEVWEKAYDEMCANAKISVQQRVDGFLKLSDETHTVPYFYAFSTYFIRAALEEHKIKRAFLGVMSPYDLQICPIPENDFAMESKLLMLLNEIYFGRVHKYDYDTDSYLPMPKTM